jgi:hypothetical protein
MRRYTKKDGTVSEYHYIRKSRYVPRPKKPEQRFFPSKYNPNYIIDILL